MGYRVKMWGWEERRAIEGMQEKYMKWVIGLDWVTPGYMTRDEGKREKLRLRAARRAWRFEEKLKEGGGNFWARECLKEIEKRGKKRVRLSRWEIGRVKFMKERGVKQGGSQSHGGSQRIGKAVA